MRTWFLLMAAAFGITLAVVLGVRLEEGSLAVVVGVVCGILAGLPVSGALFYLFWRERQERLRLEQRSWRGVERPAAAPPVVILNSGRGAELLPRGFEPQGYALGEAGPREFVIVGEEDPSQQS